MAGLILILQQPSTTALTKTKPDIAKKALIATRFVVYPHHILDTVPLSTNLSGPEPLTQVELLSSDNEQDVYTLKVN